MGYFAYFCYLRLALTELLSIRLSTVLPSLLRPPILIPRYRCCSLTSYLCYFFRYFSTRSFHTTRLFFFYLALGYLTYIYCEFRKVFEMTYSSAVRY